jgi:hypothetical protein
MCTTSSSCSSRRTQSVRICATSFRSSGSTLASSSHGSPLITPASGRRSQQLPQPPPHPDRHRRHPRSTRSRSKAGCPQTTASSSTRSHPTWTRRGLAPEWPMKAKTCDLRHVRRSPQKPKKPAMCRGIETWRDPDSNWGHHDFQGRVTGAGKARKALQIGGSQIARSPRRYP